MDTPETAGSQQGGTTLAPAADPPDPGDPGDPGAPGDLAGSPGWRRWLAVLPVRWLPLVAGVLAVAGILVAADTSVADLLRYAGYVTLAVGLPGTLCYRAVRRTPHTLVEDVAMGLAVGLCLELAGWAVFAAAGLHRWMWLWPLAVVLPFAAVPRLRRHWRPTGYAPTPVGWSWSVSAVVVFFTSYLSAVFLERNPVLPASEETLQYLDLPYQLSLAGSAKHDFPVQLPQVAGEPLHYHWFGYVHMAAVSLVGQIDLPVVSLRLAVPGLCALAAVLTAVVGWRVSGRPYVGAGAAVLFWVIGEVDFRDPTGQLFGTQATFVVWHGMSMTYSWVLLIAVIAPLAEVAGRTTGSRVPELGRGSYLLIAMLALASSGAKASSLPVLGVTLLGAAGVLLLARRRIPWPVVFAGLIVAAAEVWAVAVLFHFEMYGLRLVPFGNTSWYWLQPVPHTGVTQVLVVSLALLAFLINMESRGAGVLAVLWLRRLRLDAAQVLLLSGAVAGILLYAVFTGVSFEEQYLLRAGFPFVVILSAWGWAMVADRARPDPVTLRTIGVGAVLFGVELTLLQFRFATEAGGWGFDLLQPLLRWSGGFAALVVVVALLWRPLARWQQGMRGRGGLVLLTAVLVFGAPGLVMDMRKSMRAPNGGPNAPVSLPRSRVDAARWTRDHSRPDDVIATNSHCLVPADSGCDTRVFWLSAYAERAVLAEGWGFAPRRATPHTWDFFWDPHRLEVNDAAFTAPTPAVLRELHDRYRVRFLVADRRSGAESPQLATLTTLRFDNGPTAVYELR